MSDRACLRCIAKKRRCDHTRPICGGCRKLNVECEYPPPQARRGPVAGLSKRAESRVQQCENALWFLMTIPEVQDAVRRQAEAPLSPAPSARLDRIQRAEWWAKHPLVGVSDLLAFAHESDVLNAEGGGGGLSLDASAAGMSAGASTSAPENGDAEGTNTAAGDALPDGDDYLPQEYQYHVPADVPRALNSQASRNAMGPSLWQLVSAAIPDEVDVDVGDVAVDVGVDVGEQGIVPVLADEDKRHDQAGEDGDGARSRKGMRFGVGQDEWPYGEERKSRKRGRGEVFW